MLLSFTRSFFKQTLVLSMFGCLLGSLTTAVAQEKTRDITVTASEHIWSGPESARISLEIKATSSNATKAYQATAIALANLRKAVEKVAKTKIENRGERLIDASSKANAPIAAGSSISSFRYLGIRTTETSKIPALTDAILTIPGTSVIDIDYSSPDEGTEFTETLKRLSARAKSKAATIAAALGGRLGPLESALLTEEPDGGALRRQLQRPGDPLRFSDRERDLLLTARFLVLYDSLTVTSPK